MKVTGAIGPRLNRWLADGTAIRAGEVRSVLGAGGFFFVVLAGVMMLRPVREALGLSRGIENVRGLFLLTLGATLAVAPLFGWLASRVRREKLVAVSFRACAVLLLGFAAGLSLLAEGSRGWVGSVYYVFHSVFNLFVVSLFWAFMADHFSLAQSKRLFPPIAVGGTLGAIAGSWLSWQLAGWVSGGLLFVLAALLLELAVWLAGWVGRIQPGAAGAPAPLQPIGGHVLGGIEAVAKSRYMVAIGAFVVLVGVVSTFLYFTGLRLVAAASDSTEQRTVLFANINLWTQVATLFAQAFLATRIIRVAGVGAALGLLPALAAAGALALAVFPTLLAFTVVNAAFRAVQQGVTGPARETLFTVLEPEPKYKAKSFLDTFGYRTGDVAGAQMERWLAGLGPGLISLAVAVAGLALVWIWLSRFLGRAQAGFARPGGPE